MTIVTNYDHWHVGGEEAKSAPYVFSRPVRRGSLLHWGRTTLTLDADTK
jgi:hypothetical protein